MLSLPLNIDCREKVREWIVWKAARLQREWGALGGGAGALEQLAALAAALPHAHHRRSALNQLRDTLLHHDVSPFEVCLLPSNPYPPMHLTTPTIYY